jgi:hypothetical protein
VSINPYVEFIYGTNTPGSIPGEFGYPLNVCRIQPDLVFKTDHAESLYIWASTGMRISNPYLKYFVESFQATTTESFTE